MNKKGAYLGLVSAIILLMQVPFFANAFHTHADHNQHSIHTLESEDSNSQHKLSLNDYHKDEKLCLICDLDNFLTEKTVLSSLNIHTILTSARIALSFLKNIDPHRKSILAFAPKVSPPGS